MRPAALRAGWAQDPRSPEAGLLPAARFSCSPGGFVPLAASALCCWLELAQKTMTLKRLFEGNLSIILNLSNPSVCWSGDTAYAQLMVFVQLMADPLTKLGEESRRAFV